MLFNVLFAAALLITLGRIVRNAVSAIRTAKFARSRGLIKTAARLGDVLPKALGAAVFLVLTVVCFIRAGGDVSENAPKLLLAGGIGGTALTLALAAEIPNGLLYITEGGLVASELKQSPEPVTARRRNGKIEVFFTSSDVRLPCLVLRSTPKNLAALGRFLEETDAL
ncbi:MAG: hypothetical protein NC299_03205 [Lachnospiraceae bacterium]|nr:hypothetical protein [Ruminococcus sp.]MCM1274357.1 hypothetical protein [Lachnospiraceae bacterium]